MSDYKLNQFYVFLEPLKGNDIFIVQAIYGLHEIELQCSDGYLFQRREWPSRPAKPLEILAWHQERFKDRKKVARELRIEHEKAQKDLDSAAADLQEYQRSLYEQCE
jgi:hypothetical protein